MKLDVAGHILGFDAASEIGPFFGVEVEQIVIGRAARRRL